MGSLRSMLLEAAKTTSVNHQQSSSRGVKKIKRGFIAVYVGEERARFMVRTTFLSHPLFKILLEKATDEFEFDHTTSTGGLIIPCSVSDFREVLEGVEEVHEHGHGGFDITKLFHEQTTSSSSSSSNGRKKIKRGFVGMYVGEDKERFRVRTTFLSHPLFKILLEKNVVDEFGFGFEQTTSTGGLVIPCSVSAFREVLEAVEGEGRSPKHGGFDITKLLQGLIGHQLII